jgi:anti-anti-sigma factor
MDYDICPAAGATEVRFTGRMTFDDNEKFLNVVAALEHPAAARVVFDLSRLDFMDSAGMGMLMLAQDVAQRRKLDFALKGARDGVRRSLDLARFNTLIPFLD